jgi:hypothetical protein
MPIDMKVFLKNQSEVSPEQLEKYMGQWIAWSPGGAHVVAASAESLEAVYQMLEKDGLDLSEHVIDYVPDMGTI